MAVSGVDIVNYAKKFLGTPYVWGGNSLTKGIDCSGLVQQVYAAKGIQVPRVTYDQIGVGKSVGMSKLQPGDMVFFDTDKGTAGPDHVGIYLGDGKMIHAPRPGKSVEIADMTSGYYQDIFMGGRRVSGIKGGGTASETNPVDRLKSLSPEELAAEYGWAYGFLKSNKSLAPIFDQAVKESWTPEKFQAKVRNTDWFKKNSENMRKVAVEKATDPATYAANVNATYLQLKVQAAQMGASIPTAKLKKIAEQVYSTGLDETGVKDTLGRYINFVDGTLVGQAGMFEHSMREYADQFGISLDKNTLKNQAALVARGLATEQDFQDQIAQQAASMYPAFEEQISGGQTMKQIADPYIQQLSDSLEIPYGTITLQDPLIKQALNGVNKDGRPTGMDQQTFQATVRNDPRWAQTKQAQDSVLSVGSRVLKDMGLIN